MADVKISDLTAKSAALATTDTLEINESGTSKSVTGANIIDAIASATQTLTNKTFDANATGNSLSNVDVAGLSNGVDGELITWDAAGAPAVVSVGTDGQVLTSTGAGSPPAFEDAGGGGAWTLIGTSSASTSASLTQTGLDGTYDSYVIVLSHFVPTSSAKLYLRLGTSSGILTGNYEYGTIERGSYQTTSAGRAYVSSNPFFPIISGLAGNIPTTSGMGANSRIYLTNKPFDSGTQPMIQCMATFASGTWSTASNTDGRNTVNSAIDRVQVYFSTGNISVGRMTVWGISHA